MDAKDFDFFGFEKQHVTFSVAPYTTHGLRVSYKFTPRLDHVVSI